MSYSDDLCQTHKDFVHTGNNCLMCIENDALDRGVLKERKRIVGAIESLRSTLWAYKSHEAMAMVLDDVLTAVDKDI